MSPESLHHSRVEDLDPAVLYAVLKLRVDVFVVEQECAYPELDGRDLEPDAVLHWATDAAGDVVGTLRVLRDPDGAARIGRVATAATARGAGLAARMMTAALATVDPGVDVVLDAQAPLAGWYARWGFVVDGEPFVEDGIAHVPMRRPFVAATAPLPPAEAVPEPPRQGSAAAATRRTGTLEA